MHSADYGIRVEHFSLQTHHQTVNTGAALLRRVKIQHAIAGENHRIEITLASNMKHSIRTEAAMRTKASALSRDDEENLFFN